MGVPEWPVMKLQENWMMFGRSVTFCGAAAGVLSSMRPGIVLTLASVPGRRQSEGASQQQVLPGQTVS